MYKVLWTLFWWGCNCNFLIYKLFKTTGSQHVQYAGHVQLYMKGFSSVELCCYRNHCHGCDHMGSADDVGHAAQVTSGNMSDPILAQRAVKVLTGLRCSVTLNPYLCPCRWMSTRHRELELKVPSYQLSTVFTVGGGDSKVGGVCSMGKSWWGVYDTRLASRIFLWRDLTACACVRTLCMCVSVGMCLYLLCVCVCVISVTHIPFMKGTSHYSWPCWMAMALLTTAPWCNPL